MTLNNLLSTLLMFINFKIQCSAMIQKLKHVGNLITLTIKLVIPETDTFLCKISTSISRVGANKSRTEGETFFPYQNIVKL